MMDDRELLERAARAAGIRNDGDGPRVDDEQGFFLRDWNPLEDDGDALRLVIKLKLEVGYYGGDGPGPGGGGPIVKYFDGSKYDKTNYGWQSVGEYDSGDKGAAYRRAIVRAAAALGGK